MQDSGLTTYFGVAGAAPMRNPYRRLETFLYKSRGNALITVSFVNGTLPYTDAVVILANAISMIIL